MATVYFDPCPLIQCTPPGCSLQAGRQSELPKGSVKLGSSQTGATVVGGWAGGAAEGLSLAAADSPQSGQSLHPCPNSCRAVDQATAQHRHGEGLQRRLCCINVVPRPDLRSSMLLLPG
jgi:hypothetical protein